MQYHYVVGYDDETEKWFLEWDTTAYFPDGNVWDNERSESSIWGYAGWFVPDEDDVETKNAAVIDGACQNILTYIIDTFPVPVVE